MKKRQFISSLLGATMLMNTLPVATASATDYVNWDLFDRFVKYDLCIADFDKLTAEQQELCKFIFETERSDMLHVRCERARRILDNENVGDRVTPEDIQKGTYIANSDLPIRGYNYDRVFAVPDIVYTDDTTTKYEYWLDDEGTNRALVNDFFSEIYEYIENGSSKPINVDMTEKYEEKTFDIWKYVLLPDDTAMIIDSTLPKFGDIQPIEEATVVPSEIDGHVVSAFYEATSNTGITKLVIPETIKNLGYLKNMPYLTALEINAPELEMTTSGFVNCPLLKSVELNVKEIGNGNTFIECPALESVNIKGAEKIMSGAFTNCTSIEKLILPENLEIIAQGAFYGTSLKELVIPKDVKLIGSVQPAYKELNVDENGNFNVEIVDALLNNDCIVNSDCVLKGNYGTAIHNYAVKNHLKFYAIDELDYGDTNSDGAINVADAVVLQKYILGTGKIGCEGDMNRDGRIDVFDMSIMRNCVIEK